MATIFLSLAIHSTLETIAHFSLGWIRRPECILACYPLFAHKSYLPLFRESFIYHLHETCVVMQQGNEDRRLLPQSEQPQYEAAFRLFLRHWPRPTTNLMHLGTSKVCKVIYIMKAARTWVSPSSGTRTYYIGSTTRSSRTAKKCFEELARKKTGPIFQKEKHISIFANRSVFFRLRWQPAFLIDLMEKG